ncbi:MAG: 4-hydroxyphenylacetate 3-hydroxylase N-terminal domain-containing protein [Dehalococcoidia bacterium]|jgi:aromatic ring hydroxylase
MKTYDEYLKSLKDGREIYYRGKKVDDLTVHPILKHTPVFLGRIHHGYMLTPEQNEKYFFKHPESGLKISKFYKIPRSSQDLLDRFQMAWDFTADSLINIAHIGSDMFFSMMIASKYMGEEYAKRMDAFAKYLVTENPVLAGCQMDVKGDRSLRPGEQKDPDMHVHVVEERKDGIIVSGAKTHASWAYAANELLVIPSRAPRKGEEHFAVGFAISPGTKGIRMLLRPALELESSQSDIEQARRRTAGHFTEAMIIFDKVFIPWERVFIYKDFAQGSRLALNFALWHRFTAVSYRGALATMQVGMAKLLAQYNGIDGVAHITRNIADLIMYAEIQRVCAKMAALECSIEPKTGIAIPNSLVTNVGKLYSNTGHFKAKQAVIDTAGGMAITAPSGEDFANPLLKKDIDKYLAGHDVSGIDRYKLFILLRESLGLYGGLEDVGELHAEGSILPSVMELYRTYNYGPITKLIKHYAEIE